MLSAILSCVGEVFGHPVVFRLFLGQSRFLTFQGIVIRRSPSHLACFLGSSCIHYYPVYCFTNPLLSLSVYYTERRSAFLSSAFFGREDSHVYIYWKGDFQINEVGFREIRKWK